MWNANVHNIYVVSHSHRYIHIRLFDNMINSYWQLTCVYGYPQHA